MNVVLGLQKLSMSAAGLLGLNSEASVTCSSYSTGGCLPPPTTRLF